jgi:DNA-binding beta-propeller fold protein YncE
VLCALAACAALLCISLAVAEASPGPVASIGETVVTPPTSRSGTATQDFLWLPGEESLGRVARDPMVVQPSIELTGSGIGPVAVESVVTASEGVWAALPAEQALALLDAGTGAELRRITVGGHPYALAVEGPDLWLTSFDDGRVLRVDRATGEVLAMIDDIDGPTGVRVTDGQVWVVANGSSRVVRIDALTARIVAQAILPGRPHSLAVGASGVWTANGRGGSVSHLDPGTGQVIATISVPGDAYDIEIAGGSVWVTVGGQEAAAGGAVARIDPTADAVVETLPFPGAWALIADGDSLWVSGSDERGGLLAPVLH